MRERELRAPDPSLSFLEIDLNPTQVEAHALGLVIIGALL
jgi:hypothetical protein